MENSLTEVLSGILCAHWGMLFARLCTSDVSGSVLFTANVKHGLELLVFKETKYRLERVAFVKLKSREMFPSLC